MTATYFSNEEEALASTGLAVYPTNEVEEMIEHQDVMVRISTLRTNDGRLIIEVENEHTDQLEWMVVGADGVISYHEAPL